MVKRLLAILLLANFVVCVNAQHLPNVGFEDWKGNGNAGSSYQSSCGSVIGSTPEGLRKRPGDEPSDWNGSSVNQKVIAVGSKVLIEKSTEDDENSWAILKTAYVGAGNIGSNAPGYLTFGTPWVYAVVTVDDCDGGTYGGWESSYKPDAITGKFKKTHSDDGEDDSYIIAYIWNGTFKSNIKATGTVVKENTDHAVLGSESATGISAPTSGYDKTNGNLIAWCNYSFTSTTNDDWQTIEVPLNYISANKNLDAQSANIIISAGNYWDRNSLQDGTTLEVDDVDYVYWNTLKSLKYDGEQLLSGNKTSYTVNKNCDQNLLVVEPKSLFGTYTTSYNSSSGVMNIIVSRANASNKTYKITFYGSELSAASYDGSEISWDGNNTATINANYVSSKLDLTAPAKATILKSFDYETAKLTITVQGGNINSNSSNYHTYTIQFDGPKVDATKDKQITETLYVDVDGELIGPQDANVTIRTLDNGNFNFVLNNFYLNPAMPVGNIAVGNLALDSNNNFSYNDDIVLEAGDDGNVQWMGPGLGNVPIALSGQYDNITQMYYVSIDISIMGQTVQVHLGYDYNIPTMIISDAKYGTFISPYDITTPNGVTATTVTSVAANGTLVLSDALATIPANTPVVVYSETPVNTSMEGYYVKHGCTYSSGLLTGVYAATEIESGYVLQNLDNKVAFYQVSASDPITVPANRCYLTLPNPSVKALVFPDGTQTSISAIQAADEKAVMYDLSGRRVSKATKGIYITNGKKVLVK